MEEERPAEKATQPDSGATPASSQFLLDYQKRKQALLQQKQPEKQEKKLVLFTTFP